MRVIDEIDPESSTHDVRIGSTGVVIYLEYDCGCSQTYPHDPMIGVRLWDRNGTVEFWSEELAVT